MNKTNFNAIMEDIIKRDGQGKKLLLHACCAPCASACIERLKDVFDITVYFYNPNIDSEQEYSLREAEIIRLGEKFNVKVIYEDHNKQSFLDVVNGLENEKEGGKRCEKCFSLRLDSSAKKCALLGCDYFATTLTISPLKNATLINNIGQEVAKSCGVNYLPTDFKKKGGYLRSIELSNELALYRQNYCGCEFSKPKN